MPELPKVGRPAEEPGDLSARLVRAAPASLDFSRFRPGEGDVLPRQPVVGVVHRSECEYVIEFSEVEVHLDGLDPGLVQHPG